MLRRSRSGRPVRFGARLSFLLALALVVKAAAGPVPAATAAATAMPAAAAPKLADAPIADDEEILAHLLVTTGKDTLGTIVIRLHHKYAPAHVRNFVKLVEDGFYEGLLFHRTSPESFVQGGDPLSRDADPSNDGTGGPGYELTPEINDKTFVRGTVGAAQMTAKDNGSQFFICLKDHPSWDGKYTPFGSVIQGIEVADRVAAAKRKGERPVQAIRMNVRVEKRTRQVKLY